MMFKFKYLLFTFFLFAYVAGHTQYIGTDDEPVKKTRTKAPSARKINKKNTAKAIKQLKNGGAVLYMIRDLKTSSSMLKEKGYDKLAESKEAEAKKKNQFIIGSLAKKFTFCPIYFFYQSDLEKIQRGEISGNLVDTNLVKVPGLSFNHNYFLILDYGDVYDETGKIYSDTAKSDLSGKMSLKNDSFVFKNKYLSQLTEPFPFFQTCHYPYKEIYIKIKRINKRLNKFYEKHAE